MKRALLLAGLMICLPSSPLLQAANWHIGLSQYGYENPPAMQAEGGFIAMTKHIDFDAEGNILVGFVVSDPPVQPGPPQFKSRQWRMVKFSNEGKYLFMKDILTRSWYDNGIYGGSNGTFLARTLNRLELFSSEGKLLAERILPTIRNGFRITWRMDTSPSREKFYLEDYSASKLEVLNSQNLSPVISCDFGKTRTLRLLSETSMLVKGPSRLGPYDDGLEIGKICGSPEWRYDVEVGGPIPWQLLDQSRTVAIHKGTLILQDHGKEQWRYKVDRKKGEGVGNDIRSDELGKVFAIGHGRSVGGSDFFDKDGKLVSKKIIVFRSSDGKILVEAPIKPVEAISPGQDFSISRDGKHIAIMDEGELRVIQIPIEMDLNSVESRDISRSAEFVVSGVIH